MPKGATVLTDRWLEVQDKPLLRGGHTPDGEFCAMEMAAYVAGEPWSDAPKCVSPAIRGFMASWNDALEDDERQALKPYIPKVIGTQTTQADEKRRAYIACDWLVRTFTPAWLDLAGLTADAAALRALPEMTTDELANAAMPAINAAREKAWAADSAARSAAYSAACSAARSAAYSAARSAACSAAYSAARSAACSAACSAAYSAARSALAPTVKALQAEALVLLDRLIAVGKAN